MYNNLFRLYTEHIWGALLNQLRFIKAPILVEINLLWNNGVEFFLPFKDKYCSVHNLKSLLYIELSVVI